MSVLGESLEQVRGAFRPVIDVVKRRFFGANNERLDFVMDSFYKLSSRQQSTVMAAFFGGLFVLVGVIFAVYFTRLNTLENELSAGYEALREIRSQTKIYKVSQARLDWLKQNVDSKTKADAFKPKPHFEKIANKIGVTMEGLRSENVEIPKDSPLAAHFREIQVSFTLTQVSIPRMLKFLAEIEKSGKNLTVRDLNIRARYGDRLYFDVTAAVTGYQKL